MKEMMIHTSSSNCAQRLYEPAQNVFEQNRSLADVVVGFNVQDYHQYKQNRATDTSPDNCLVAPKQNSMQLNLNQLIVICLLCSVLFMQGMSQLFPYKAT